MQGVGEVHLQNLHIILVLIQMKKELNIKQLQLILFQGVQC